MCEIGWNRRVLLPCPCILVSIGAGFFIAKMTMENDNGEKTDAVIKLNASCFYNNNFKYCV